MAKDYIIIPANTAAMNEADNETDAVTRADELARSEPGSSWAVYARVSTSSSEKPTGPAPQVTTARNPRAVGAVALSDIAVEPALELATDPAPGEPEPIQ